MMNDGPCVYAMSMIFAINPNTSLKRWTACRILSGKMRWLGKYSGEQCL